MRLVATILALSETVLKDAKTRQGAGASRYRPMLERRTGLSVVEVMREFGYRPARLIGWRRIRGSLGPPAAR